MKIIKFVVFVILAAVLVGCKSETSSTTQPTVAPEVLAKYDAIKLAIREEGIYRLPLEDLGWDESIIDSIAITQKDSPIPYWVERNETGSSIIFYGQASSSAYTPENIYIVQQDATLAQPMSTIPLETDGAAVDFIISTVHSEENHLYTPKVEDGNPWHWYKIVAPQSQDIEINIAAPAQGPAHLQMALWGATAAPTSPDHHIRVSVNQQVIGEATWDEQTRYLFEAEIPAGALVDGVNTIRIHATGEVEARIDIINLDWIEINYPKSADRLEAQERFHVPTEAVQMAGFEGKPAIFEISSPSEISRLELPSENENPLIFQGNPDYVYIATSQDAYLRPSQITPVMTTPNLRASAGADYLAIGHPTLLEPLEPLLKARNEQGLSSLSVPVEAIYDQFNGGMVEPDAIQQFLKFAVENWKTPPQYVLLVGDTSYDYYGYQTPTENIFLPTFLVPTVFGGETGSDVIMAQINDDEWPDLAIGRVPARSRQQVETFVSKTLNFEQSSAATDLNLSILAIADGQEDVFKKDAERFVEQFPPTYHTQLIAPAAGAQDTNQLITTEIESGQLLTAYFGHGSVNMWGKDSLFTIEDSANLENSEHLPIMLNFTCLTGLFTHPTEESLAESLLFNPNGGAVAVLAPTSPTLPGDQTFLSNAFIEAMLQKPAPRLGDITLFAWRKVPTFSEGAVDVMQTFLLFGDPALQMPSP